MRLTIYILLLFISIGQSHAQQKYLALENMRKFRRVVFKPGDYISFRSHDSKAKFSGRVIAIDDSMLTIAKSIKLENDGDGTNNVYEDRVPLKEIASVYYIGDKYWQFFKGMYAGTAIVGGLGLLAITGLNYATDSNRTPIDENSVIAASALAVSGGLVILLGGRNYKKLKKKQWNLRVIDAFDPILTGEK